MAHRRKNTKTTYLRVRVPKSTSVQHPKEDKPTVYPTRNVARLAVDRKGGTLPPVRTRHKASIQKNGKKKN